MKVAVLAGGRSCEHDVSLASAKGIGAAVVGLGHELIEIIIDRDGVWCCGDQEIALSPGKGLLGSDVVFPALHGAYGEDGTVQGLLELIDVPYVGSGVLSSALCINKRYTKQVLGQAGIPQLDYIAFDHCTWLDK